MATQIVLHSYTNSACMDLCSLRSCSLCSHSGNCGSPLPGYFFIWLGRPLLRVHYAVATIRYLLILRLPTDLLCRLVQPQGGSRLVSSMVTSRFSGYILQKILVLSCTAKGSQQVTYGMA